MAGRGKYEYECGSETPSGRCGHKLRLPTERMTEDALYNHLRYAHRVWVDPGRPSRKFFGWVYPVDDDEPRHGGHDRDDGGSGRHRR